MKKFLTFIFASTLILGACDTKDVEDSAKKRKILKLKWMIKVELRVKKLKKR